MNAHPVSDQLIGECAQALAREKSDEKFIGWETLVSILVYEGLRAMLPEIRVQGRWPKNQIVLSYFSRTSFPCCLHIADTAAGPPPGIPL